MDISLTTLEAIAPFILVGFAAQVVDGALGMAFGVISNTLLLSMGVPPAAASAGVHTVETFTTAVSGISHALHRNVDWRLFLRLMIPGVAGGALGAYVLSNIDAAVAKPFILAYLAIIGGYLLWRAFRYPPKPRQPRIVEPLGLVGGFLDAAGGGGWGPVVTSNLLVQGAAPRMTIGTVNTAEFFLTTTISATFITQLGWEAFTLHAGAADRRGDRSAVRRGARQAGAAAAADAAGRDRADADQPLRPVSRGRVTPYRSAMPATYLPTLKQLQYLVALRDQGHFGRAAEACFVGQSTLSAGIRELETLIGVTLVERTRRVVRFTTLGERIADKARRVLREAEELGDMARAAGRPLSGEMRMSVIPTIAPFLLPRILPRLRRDYPDLRLFLREEPSGAACEALNNGRADCVLLALPYACGEVTSRALFDDRLFVAFQGDADEARAAIPASAIDTSQLLLLENGHCLKDHALAACDRPGAREAAMMGTSLHTIVQMVDNGLGITMLPEMAVKAGILDHSSVVAAPVEGDAATRTIALAWRRASPRERDFGLLADVLAQAGSD